MKALASVSLATVDLHASRFVLMSAVIRVIASRVLACALLDFWVPTAPSRAAATATELATTLESVSASQVGQVETAPLC